MERCVTLWASKKYNNFFYPNICHVCKVTQNLIECPSCGLVSYCSWLHMLEHKIEHKQICDAIVIHNSYRSFKEICNVKREGWVTFKRNNIEHMMRVLSRNLESYEQQMFLFAKSCGVCHVQKYVHNVCRDCFSANLCEEHSACFNGHGCSQLKLCLELDKYNTYNLDRSKNVWKEYVYLDMNLDNVHNMELFIENCIQHRNCIQYSNGEECDRTEPMWILLTDDFSGPLTLFYSMQRTELLGCMREPGLFVIHIVSGFLPDISSISAWEIFFHKYLEHTTLLIVMVGPELRKKYDFVDICKSCERKSNLFQYECCCMHYYKFTTTTLPDVIIAFDVDFTVGNTWSKVIKAYQHHGCPLLLTAKSNFNADENLRIIRKVLGSHINPLFHEENKFVSKRPYRDYENEFVYYPNKYLTFFRNLICPK